MGDAMQRAGGDADSVAGAVHPAIDIVRTFADTTWADDGPTRGV